jgi:hypothetical protein
MAAPASASQNSTTGRRRPVHQRSLPYWLAPGVGALHWPAAADLDRCGQPTGGDLTDHCQRDAARVGGDRALRPVLAAVHRTASGDPAAAGRLGGAAVHRQVLQLQAEDPLVGAKHRQAQLLGHAGADPLAAAAAQGGRRAGGVGDPAVAAAEHQHLDELVEDDPVAGCAAGWQPSGWWTWRAGSSAQTWTHRGSRTDDGRAGTRPPCDRRV